MRRMKLSLQTGFAGAWLFVRVRIMQLTPALSFFQEGALPLRFRTQHTRRITIAQMLSYVCGFLLAAGTLVGADLSGDWEFSSKYLGDVSYARVTLKIEGGKLTGN